MINRKLVLVCAGLIASANCTYAAIAKSAPKQHLKYFGYYHANGFNLKAPGYIPEIGILGNSNVAIIGTLTDEAEIKLVLQSCAKYKIKAFITAYDCFFQWKPGKIGQSTRYGNWKLRWKLLKKAIQGYEDHVIGFYFDEPYWCGVKEEDFHLATKTIHRDFPNKRILACTTALELDPTTFKSNIPEVSGTYYKYVTDCTFDYYAPWEEIDYPAVYEKLKAKTGNNKSYWLIPWLFTRPSGGCTSQVLEQHLINMYSLALSDPKCVGLLPFTFASLHVSDVKDGGHEFFNPASPIYAPDLKKLHLEIGRSIVNGKVYPVQKK